MLMSITLKLLTQILLSFCFLIAFRGHSQQKEKQALQEFIGGNILKYSSLGLGKSQGLKLHLKYPVSWQSKEGERPHIVRKFIQQDQATAAMVYIQKREKVYTQSEIDYNLNKENIISESGQLGKVIYCDCSLKIEGLKACRVDIMQSGQRMDQPILSYMIQYSLIYKQYYLSIQFMIIKKKGESDAVFMKRQEAIISLSKMMFNSLVIDNIWE